MQKISDLKEKLQTGDLKTAAAVLNIGESNASKALNRVGSKHHEAIVKILSKVVDIREKLMAANKED